MPGWKWWQGKIEYFFLNFHFCTRAPSYFKGHFACTLHLNYYYYYYFLCSHFLLISLFTFLSLSLSLHFLSLTLALPLSSSSPHHSHSSFIPLFLPSLHSSHTLFCPLSFNYLPPLPIHLLVSPDASNSFHHTPLPFLTRNQDSSKLQKGHIIHTACFFSSPVPELT